MNVLIGENNSGKTSIIDLLHLVFEEGNYPRDIYWKETDFRMGSEEIQPIEFDIIFNIDNEMEEVWYNSLHVVVPNENGKLVHCLEIHGKIELINFKSNKRIRRTLWGGKDQENKIPWEILNSLNCIYLSPLRDVNQDLKPNKGSVAYSSKNY